MRDQLIGNVKRSQPSDDIGRIPQRTFGVAALDDFTGGVSLVLTSRTTTPAVAAESVGNAVSNAGVSVPPVQANTDTRAVEGQGERLVRVECCTARRRSALAEYRGQYGDAESHRKVGPRTCLRAVTEEVERP